MSSPLAGAEITTFLAPAARCLSASGRSVNRPVLSSTRSTPSAFHGSFSGSLMADTLMGLPLTTRASPCGSTVPGKRRGPDAYFRQCAPDLPSVIGIPVPPLCDRGARRPGAPAVLRAHRRVGGGCDGGAQTAAPGGRAGGGRGRPRGSPLLVGPARGRGGAGAQRERPSPPPGGGCGTPP